MKYAFIIFFTIILSLYAAVNYYIISKGLSVIPGQSSWRTVWIWAVVVLAASFVAGRLLERVFLSPLSTALIWMGSVWMAMVVYLLLMLLFVDLVSLLDRWIGFLPSFMHHNPLKVKQIIAVVIASVTLLTVFIGFINTRFIKVRDINLEVHKKAGNLKSLHVVAFSDVHLGTLMGERHIQRIVKIANSLHPDIILIPGDIIDEDIGPVVNSRMGSILEQLHAKYGVYAVTGNHEYIGGVKNAKKFLSEHGVHMLNDTVVEIDSSFYVAGREDRTKNRMQGGRKSVENLLVDVSKDKPVILLDHQPYHLEEAEQNGVALQLSGHTHHGQIWPFNYITKAIFEVSRGYLKKGNSHFYVSSGVGGWGPPVRTVSRPEILNIHINFDKK
ncbi:MAG: metallophosphoesterase [Bacteroidales bacterium]|nr:metallophosphoesterase [Bacteroidales bacterium]